MNGGGAQSHRVSNLNRNDVGGIAGKIGRQTVDRNNNGNGNDGTGLVLSTPFG